MNIGGIRLPAPFTQVMIVMFADLAAVLVTQFPPFGCYIYDRVMFKIFTHLITISDQVFFSL